MTLEIHFHVVRDTHDLPLAGLEPGQLLLASVCCKMLSVPFLPFPALQLLWFLWGQQCFGAGGCNLSPSSIFKEGMLHKFPA